MRSTKASPPKMTLKNSAGSSVPDQQELLFLPSGSELTETTSGNGFILAVLVILLPQIIFTEDLIGFPNLPIGFSVGLSSSWIHDGLAYTA
jgi:hypothetical protein